MQESPDFNGSERFHTTAWTMIHAAGAESSLARQSLESLCTIYWSPLYVWLRRSGASVSDAEDQLQGFFVHLIEHGVLDYADPSRGRFRSFLITALKQYLAKQHRFRTAGKRQPKMPIVSLDAERGETVYRLRRSPEETPEQAFERAWALAVIEQVSVQLRAEYARKGKAELFDALSGTLTGQKPLSGHDLAERRHMNEAAVRVAAFRLKQRYGRRSQRPSFNQTTSKRNSAICSRRKKNRSDVA